MSKPTKRLEKLAAEIVKNDVWMNEDSLPHVAQTLADVKHALRHGRYYTGVESVARSGMSRVIRIGWIKGGKMRSAPDYVYKLAGCDVNQRISGCGMDMLFAAQYNLFQSLCDQRRTPYQSHMARYRSL